MAACLGAGSTGCGLRQIRSSTSSSPLRTTFPLECHLRVCARTSGHGRGHERQSGHYWIPSPQSNLVRASKRLDWTPREGFLWPFVMHRRFNLRPKPRQICQFGQNPVRSANSTKTPSDLPTRPDTPVRTPNETPHPHQSCQTAHPHECPPAHRTPWYHGMIGHCDLRVRFRLRSTNRRRDPFAAMGD